MTAQYANNNLNIVMATDKNYIIPTMVTLASVMSSANKDTFFNIYILCAKNLEKESRQLLKTLEKKYNCMEIHFIEIVDKRLEKAVTIAHIPVASYYRLYISKYLKADRCLFIDGDMIVKHDLTEVYNTDFEGCYIIGVKDLGIQSNYTKYTDYAKYLEIDDMNSYVNAGFMIFNLKKIRQDKLDEKMIEAIDRGYKYMDQDILNKYCYGKIKNISLKYDFFMEYYENIQDKKLDGYGEDLEYIKDNIVVYHYTGIFKPWLCRRLRINGLWWEQAANVLDKDIYDTLIQNANEFETKSDWLFLQNLIKNERQIVICGFSEIGKKIAKKILNDNNDKQILFADNDISKENEDFNNVCVTSILKAYDKYPDAIYIISSQNGFRQIKEQLNRIGINDKRIYRYIYKDETYYSRLDEKYREYESYQRI